MAFLLNILNGVSIAIVVCLVPQALISEIAKALLPWAPWLQEIIAWANLGATAVPLAIGVLAAIQFSFTPVQTMAVGLASYVGSGIAQVTPEGALQLVDIGLVINCALNTALACGVACIGWTLAIAGWKHNGFAGALLSVFGSPKVHLANIWGRPINFLPLACVSLVVGAVSGVTGILGNSMSAGFGLSGLVGPLTQLNAAGWSLGSVAHCVLMWVILPGALGYLSVKIFTRRGIITPDHYRLALR